MEQNETALRVPETAAELTAPSPALERTGMTLSPAQAELFYALKNETRDRLGDEALIRAMAVRFNGSAGGSADALASTPPEWFLRCDAAGGKEPEDD